VTCSTVLESWPEFIDAGTRHPALVEVQVGGIAEL